MQTTNSTLCSPVCKHCTEIFHLYVYTTVLCLYIPFVWSTRAQDLNPVPPPAGVATALEVITYIGLVVSILSLLLMVVTYFCSKWDWHTLTSCQWLATLQRVGLCTAAADYFCIPSLPRNLCNSHHGLIILNICFALLGLYLFFLIAAHVTTVPWLCGLVSALLHYFILVFFAWTAAEAVYLYIKLVKVMGVDKYVRGYTWKAGLPAWSKLLGCYLSCYGLLRRNHPVWQLFQLWLSSFHWEDINTTPVNTSKSI